MRLKSLLLGTSLLALVPVLAHAEDRLQPRAEVGVKAGSERSVLTTEFWAPLAQKSDRVIYADVRLMGDSDENREGNLGFGYRQLSEKTNSVLGVHGWIDRRRTEYNNTFHEVTFGAESLGNSIDLRANGYIALGGSETAITPNTGPTTPYLAGTGLFYNTNGSVTETPQHGVDAEAGYRLPVLEKHVDTVRVFGGGYHFFRSGTDNVTGIRIRTEAQINPALSVGARFQHDGPRGSQGFLEATLKFPFSAKKMFRTSGLRARLDESPERDIDIVTGAKVDNGQRQIVNQTSGDAQRILYVDNTNTQSGDGSYENPFSTLKAAEASLKANDILYVRSGNGTTSGMDQGINITQSGVSLIGSGSALTVGGITFLNAGNAPVFTNNTTYVQDTVNNIYTGNGVFITGANANISGIIVNGAQGSSIFALANTGSNWNSININNTASLNVATTAGITGINVLALNGGQIANVTASNNTSSRGLAVTSSGAGSLVGNTSVTGNTVSGFDIVANANTNGRFNTVAMDNNIVTNSVSNGLSINVSTGGFVDSATITNSIATGSVAGSGIAAYVRTGGVLNTFTVQNANVSNNLQQGVYASADTANGKIGTVNFSNITATGNAGSGVRFRSGGTGSEINQINASNINVAANGQWGMFVYAQTGGTINNAAISNVTASGNTSDGIYVLAQTTGTMGQIGLNAIISSNNIGAGVNVQVDNANSVIGYATLANVLSTSNNAQGVQVISSSGGAITKADLNSITTMNNQSHGVSFFTTGTGSTLGQMMATNVTSFNNRQYGIITQLNTAGNRLDNLAISNSVVNGNAQSGIFVNTVASGATITNTTISGNTANGNTVKGIYVAASASGVLNNVAVTNNTANSNLSDGILTQLSTTAQIGSLAINGNTANSNTVKGINIYLSGTGSTLGTSVISNNITNNNSSIGIEIRADNTAAISSSLVHNTSTGNAANGLFVYKNTSGSFVIDAGGGTLSSTGQNRIFNNTGTEVRIDGGYALQAQNNYWGGGDLAGGERTLNGGSTITTTGFLTVDPGQ